jgi:DNA primase
MARIADEELQRLKEQVSVQRLCEAKGVKLKAHGKDLIGLCPFHDDREPSLVVTPEKNLWHCLGACQTGGSAIDWVMRAEGVSFRLAVEMLRRDHPMLSEPSAAGRPPKRTTAITLDELAEPDEPDHVVVGRVLSHYTAMLRESPEALGYLQGRGLSHPELIERFQLGYANRTLGYRLPAATRKAGQALRGQLQRLGILRTSGHEHMSGSLVIPIFGQGDQGGELSQLYGRKITTSLRAGTPLHLYLPRPHSAVWNIEALSRSDEVILCESLIDALTFWCAGFSHVITSYGVKGFTEAHLSALKAHSKSTASSCSEPRAKREQTLKRSSHLRCGSRRSSTAW